MLAEYHYGGAFLAAMLSHIGQVDSAIIFFFLTPLAATIAYLAASVVAASVLKNIRLGLLAGLFFSFGSGLPYPIDPIRSIYLRWFTPNFSGGRNPAYRHARIDRPYGYCPVSAVPCGPSLSLGGGNSVECHHLDRTLGFHNAQS